MPKNSQLLKSWRQVLFCKLIIFNQILIGFLIQVWCQISSQQIWLNQIWIQLNHWNWIKNWSNSIEKFQNSVWKLVEIDQNLASTFYWIPVKMLDFESDRIWMTKMLESEFELTMIQCVGPNRLSLLFCLWCSRGLAHSCFFNQIYWVNSEFDSYLFLTNSTRILFQLCF